MAFDPDAFLDQVNDKPAAPAAKGFDPDAFLSQVEPPKESPGFFSRVGQSFANLGHTVASAGRGALDLVSPVSREGGLHVPFSDLADPAYRHQLERGVSDVVTGGLAEKAANAVDPKFAAAAPAEADARPDARALGQAAGMALPSPFRAAGEGAAALVPAGRGALKAGARGLAAYEAAAVPAAAIAAPEGHRLEAAADAATDPAGLVLAGALPAVAEGSRNAVGRAAGRAADALENTPGAKARKVLESRGVRVSLGSAGEGGVFDRELAGIGTGDRATGIAAERGAENLVAAIKRDHRVETSEPYRKLKEQIDNSPHSRMLQDASGLVAHMQDAVHDLETPAPVRASLAEQLSLLERYRNRDTGLVEVPARQLNGLRRELMRQAKVGMTDAPGAREAPLRAAAYEAKNLVDDGPYARLNELYSEGASRTSERRKLLGLKAKPASDEQVDINKARLNLQRGEESSNSVTAGAFADRIAKLRAMNPKYAEQIDLPQLARARNDLTFSLTPQHGGLMARAGGAMGPLEVGYNAIRHPIRTAAGLALQNKTALEGRLGPPVANYLSGLSQDAELRPAASPAAVAKLIQAARLGASREALQAQAEKDGLPPDVLAQLTR